MRGATGKTHEKCASGPVGKWAIDKRQRGMRPGSNSRGLPGVFIPAKSPAIGAWRAVCNCLRVNQKRYQRQSDYSQLRAR